MVLSDGTKLTAAGGVNYRGPQLNASVGPPIGIHSKFPAGSLTKSFTATALKQLAERGVLDLDAPIHALIDPWHAAQIPPVKPLLQLWHGDRTVLTITTRMLISMQAGLRDYDDSKLQAYSEQNPTKDVLPSEYFADLSNSTPYGLDKAWLFPPGGVNPPVCPSPHPGVAGKGTCVPGEQGVAYSSDGFVLAGMVLASQTKGVKTWDKLDQKKAIRHLLPSPDIEFSKTGPCSAHPGVVHQYGFRQQGKQQKKSARSALLARIASGGAQRWQRIRRQALAPPPPTPQTKFCKAETGWAKERPWVGARQSPPSTSDCRSSRKLRAATSRSKSTKLSPSRSRLRPLRWTAGSTTRRAATAAYSCSARAT